MKHRTRPAPGPGRGHFSVAGATRKARRERQGEALLEFYWLTVYDPDEAFGRGWGPAKGAHPPKPRNLPTQSFVHLDDLDDLGGS